MRNIILNNKKNVKHFLSEHKKRGPKINKNLNETGNLFKAPVTEKNVKHFLSEPNNLNDIKNKKNLYQKTSKEFNNFDIEHDYESEIIFDDENKLSDNDDLNQNDETLDNKIIKKKGRKGYLQYNGSNNINVTTDDINIDLNDNNIKNNALVNKKINNKQKFDAWEEKYKPTNINQILGNKTQICKIENWILNLKKTNQCSIIISGNHGTGKNLIINLLLAKAGYTIKNFHSSQMKMKTIVNEIIHFCTKTTNVYDSLNELSNENKTNYAIIIDDTESVSLTSEKNNILELFKLNNENKYFPLIFINNLQHSKLISDIRKGCQEIIFTSPSIDELQTFVKNIMKKENINIVDNKIILSLIRFAQNDIRRLLNILQDLYFTYLNENITYDMYKNYLMISHKKDIDIGLKDATTTLINKYVDSNYILQLYEREKVPLPLMICENYYKKLTGSNLDFSKILDIMMNVSDSISIGDIIETNIYSDQNWYLQSIHGFVTCVNTCYHINNNNNEYKLNVNNIDYSLDLHKTSLKNINRKNITNLQNIFKKNTLDDILYVNKYFVEIHNKINKNPIQDKNLKNIKNLNRSIFNKIKDNYNISNRNIEISMNLDKTISL